MKSLFKVKSLIGLMAIVALVLVFGVTPSKHAEADSNDFAFDDTNITHKWSNWSLNGDHAVVNTVGEWWNNFAVSTKYATKEQSVDMKMDVTFQEGLVDYYANGFAFGMPYNHDPGAQWYCFNVSQVDGIMFVRLFAVGVPNSIGDTQDYRYNLTQEEIDRGVYTLGVRIDNGGTIRCYLNDKCVAAVSDAGYNGGYIGFMSWQSSAIFSNTEIEVSDAPTSTTTFVDEEGYTLLNPLRDIKHQWGTWNKDANSMTAINNGGGDLFAMTELYVNDNQDLVFEADLTQLGHTNCAMMVFGVDQANDPGKGWYALNIQYHLDTPMARLYAANKGTIGASFDAKAKTLDATAIATKTHKFKIEAYASGRICVSLDGVVFCDTYDSEYKGGYIGFGTFWGAYMFDNIRYKITDSTNLKYETNGEVKYDALDLRSSWSWGDWGWTSDVVSANNAGIGNHFSMSTIHVDSDQNFSFEADVAATGNSAALTFGVSEINDPIKGWYALAISKDNKYARVFSEGKGTIGVASKHLINLTNEQMTSDTIHLRVEGYASGRIKAWVDGNLICDIIDSEWNGGYLGFNTFYANATYSNIKYSVSNNEATLASLKVGGHEIDLDSNKYGYIIDFPKGTNNVTVEAAALEGYSVQINDVTLSTLDYEIKQARSMIEIKVLNSNEEVVSTYHVEVRRFFDEQYRPLYHFTETETWINDPNGLVYDRTTDTYHMFYQYCIGVNNSGYFYWGHAVSNDLMTWERKNPAIAPDQNGIIFSGSCVIDENNDSGFFSEDVPAASRLIAFFTYHSSNPSIGLAYSLDFGETWVKYGRVISNENNLYGNQFRDPKVIRVEDKWLMIVGGITYTRLFSSTDLINWSLDSEVMDYYGSHLQTECPDIFPLAVDGDEKNVKWVISTAGTSYIVGSLDIVDGKFVFTAEAPAYKMYNSPNLWSNIGEVYATQSYYNDREGRRVLVSWMVDRTANVLDDKWWNGAESLPLETTLETRKGFIVMCGYPVKEVAGLREEKLIELTDVMLNNVDNPLDGVESQVFDMELELEVGTAKTITLTFCKGLDEKVTITYYVDRRVLTLDTTQSGQVASYVVSSSVTPENGMLTLRLTMDNSIVELFANGGIQSYHGFVFPSVDAKAMSINCDGGEAKLVSLTAWSMKDIH